MNSSFVKSGRSMDEIAAASKKVATKKSRAAAKDGPGKKNKQED